MRAGVVDNRISDLDALRAFAMLTVVALHSHIFPAGWMGVWLFYVLSGYVVTASVLARGEERGVEVMRDFLRRRAVRILPVYYLYIAVGLLVATLLGYRQDGTALASLALFFDNWTMINGGGRVAGWPSGHLWTLSTEMQFYLLYGSALCLLPARHVRRLLVALLLLCPLARLAAGQWLAQAGWTPLDAAFAVYAGPGLHFDIFAMGALLAFQRTGPDLSRMTRIALGAGLGAVLIYGGVYLAVNIEIRHAHGLGALRNIFSGILFGEYREVFLYSAIGLLMTGLVGAAVQGASWLRPILRPAPLIWVGRISYGGYVYHPLGLKVATLLLGLVGISTQHGGPLGHGLQFVVGLGLTLMVASASFRWLEEPLRRRLARTPHPINPSRATPAATLERAGAA